MTSARPVTLVTGASAGIGAELARVFGRHGHDLVLIARREQQLETLADEIAANGKPRPLVLAADLCRRDAVDGIARELSDRALEPQFVVNNAGFGLSGRAAALSRDEQLAMIDLNVRALTELSLAWIDQLTRRRGGILNVASVAGFVPGPGMAVYYASKAYVVSFSQALHRELAPVGVRVTALCPGPVPTEFQARAGIAGGARPRALTLSAPRVAQEGYRGLMQGRLLVVPGAGNKAITILSRFVPRGIALAVIDARQRKRTRT
jgi:short-subunit dehydrogenase